MAISKPTVKNILLFIACNAFCLFFGYRSLIVLWGVALITYFSAILVSGASDDRKRKALFWTGTLLIFSVFMLFKFLPMFTGLLSVVGLSFYALQALGYLSDVYMKKTEEEKNYLILFSYVAFFPTFLSGPIQRSTFLLPQIKQGVSFCYEKAKRGLLLILWGLFLKLLISNRLHMIVEPVFADVRSCTGATILFAALMYGIELYADFAGYTYVATGVANIMGFDMARNFTQPYFGVRIREYWRRWHISLTSWFRDYLYIPLGGNRKGTKRKYLNIMIIFFFSGLWHGNGIKYFAWGMLHGVYEVVEDVLDRHFPSRKNDGSGSGTFGNKLTIRRLWGIIRTYLLITVSWFFFRAQSLRDSAIIFKRVIFDHYLIDTYRYGHFLSGYDKGRFILLVVEMLILLVVDIIREKGTDIVGAVNGARPLVRRFVYLLLCIALILGVYHDWGISSSTFIYANF